MKKRVERACALPFCFMFIVEFVDGSIETFKNVDNVSQDEETIVVEYHDYSVVMDIDYQATIGRKYVKKAYWKE